MERTTNLSLKKPGLDDDALISDLNDNSDILDSKIGPVGNVSLQTQITNEVTARQQADSSLSDNITTQFSMVDLGIMSDIASLIAAISTLVSSLGNVETRFVKFNTNTQTDYWNQWEYHTGIVQRDDNANWTAVFAGTTGEALNIGSGEKYYSSREEKSRISELYESSIDLYGFTLGQTKEITAKPFKRIGIAFGVWSTNIESKKIIPFRVTIPANTTSLTINSVILYDQGEVTSGTYDVQILTFRAN